MAKARRSARTDAGPLEWFLHALHHLGWPGAAQARQSSARVRGLEDGGSLAVATLPDGQFLAAVATDRELPLPSEAFEAFEDHSIEYRRLARALGRLEGRIHYVVLLSPSGRAQLVDWTNDEVLLSTDSRGEAEERLLPLLEPAAVMRGSLIAHPRKSVPRRAAELEKWTRLWETRVGSALDLRRGPVERFFRALALARLCARAGAAAPGSCAFEEYAAHAKLPDAARLLRPLWRELTGTRNIVQGTRRDELEGITAAGAKDGVLGECLASFSRLSAAKFSAEILAGAFADEEARAISWRAGFLEHPPATDGEEALRRLVEPVELDLDECGYVVMLRSFDRVADQLRKSRGLIAAQRRQGELAGVQMEIFGLEPDVPADDGVAAFVLSRGLRVATMHAHRAELARMLLVCRAVEWTAHHAQFDAAFPDVVVRRLERVAPPPEQGGPVMRVAEPSEN